VSRDSPYTDDACDEDDGWLDEDVIAWLADATT
jgi:hypothetical protein